MISKIQSIFNESGIPWYIDSGSLLGLYRDGHFVKNDADIDISVYVQSKSDQNTVNEISKSIMTLGFDCVAMCWGGMDYIYKYKLLPRNGFEYKIDLMIYYILPDGSAFSPQGSKNTNCKSILHKIRQMGIDWKKGNTVSLQNGLVRRCIYYTHLFYRNYVRKEYEILDVKKLCPEFYSMLYWWMPSYFVGKISSDLLNGFPIPENPDAYLEYRYGNWKIPNKEWNFIKDDGGLRMSSPEEITSLFDGCCYELKD